MQEHGPLVFLPFILSGFEKGELVLRVLKLKGFLFPFLHAICKSQNMLFKFGMV